MVFPYISFFLYAVINFLSMKWYIMWRINPNFNLIAMAISEDGDLDIITDYYGFINIAGKYEHHASPYSID